MGFRRSLFTTWIGQPALSLPQAKLCLFIALCLLASASNNARAQTYVYQGGEIVTSPEIIAVYWGAQQAGIPAFLNDFYRRITQSTYLAPLSEYDVPSNTIGSARFVGSWSVISDDSRVLDTLQIAMAPRSGLQYCLTPTPRAAPARSVCRPQRA